jgi:hypothetical protein
LAENPRFAIALASASALIKPENDEEKFDPGLDPPIEPSSRTGDWHEVTIRENTNDARLSIVCEKCDNAIETTELG